MPSPTAEDPARYCDTSAQESIRAAEQTRKNAPPDLLSEIHANRPDAPGGDGTSGVYILPPKQYLTNGTATIPPLAEVLAGRMTAQGQQQLQQQRNRL